MDKNNIPKERIIIELNPETIAKIDVLIEKGLYPNHGKFIDIAIKSQLNTHDATFQELTRGGESGLGIFTYNAKKLEKAIARGKKLNIKVVGCLIFSDDITPDLIEKAMGTIKLTGILFADPSIQPILNKRRYSIFGRPYQKSKELDTHQEPKELDIGDDFKNK